MNSDSKHPDFYIISLFSDLNRLFFNSPIAAFTSTGSESAENWLSPAAFTALTLNTYVSPVCRPWQMNLKRSRIFNMWYLRLYLYNPQ